MKKKSKLSGIFSLRYLLYDFVKWTGALTALPFIRPKRYFIDKEAYKKLRGGFIISANHRSYLDPIIVHCAFPLRRIYTVAMERMFETPFKNWFFRRLNCIKVDRRNVSADTIRSAGEVLSAGKALCIFPEGGINSSERGTDFKQGCAMISVINNVPVLPVCLEKRKSIWRRTRVIIGKPVYPDEATGGSRSLQAIGQLNDCLYQKEQELYSFYRSLNDGKDL